MNKMQVTLIDHYDSFTFNVIDWLATERNIKIDRINFDDDYAIKNLISNPTPLVISPGPKDPSSALSTVRLVEKLWGKVPILGICLGHQIICQVAGAKIIKSSYALHGSAKTVNPVRESIILPNSPFKAASYNSLVADFSCSKDRSAVTAKCEYGEVQAVEFVPKSSSPVIGLQFHPDSFLTEKSSIIAEQWTKIIKAFEVENPH